MSKMSKSFVLCGTPVLVGMFLALSACSSDSSSGSSKVPTGNVFDSEMDLPECTDALGIDTAYVGADSTVYVCEDGEWFIPNFDDLSSSSREYSSSSFGKYENTAVSYGTLTDSRDGQTYKTVEIGTQTWMAENLNYRSPEILCSECSSADYEYFGAYYIWDDAQTVCPEGWHLPDTTEWNVLEAFVADSLFGGEKDSVGYALKSTVGWASYHGDPCNGSDAFGFAAVPSGYVRESDTLFAGAQISAYFATATESDSLDTEAYFRSLSNIGEDMDLYLSSKSANGRSVRCVKD